MPRGCRSRSAAGRERVLGFTRGEISAILLGELALVTLMAIPIGLMMGYLFAGLLVAAFNTELYRFRWWSAPERSPMNGVTLISR